METFTPWSALIGGGLIGASAALLLLLHGRIAGISGIWTSMLRFTPGDFAWRAAFVGGLLIGGVLLLSITPDAMVNTVPRSLPVTVLAGLLVGLGTRIGGGCTSGHGVCGISRFSPRSILATITFMAAGGVTAFIGQHLFEGAP